MEENELSTFVIGAMIELNAGNIGRVERRICRAAAEISGLTPRGAIVAAEAISTVPILPTVANALLRFAELAADDG
jgi:hypothetical protein